MIRSLKKLTRRLAEFCLRDVADAQERALLLAGRQQAQRVRAMPDGAALRDAEFRVYSQWGEDGILQYLLGRMDIAHDFFVEFGVENYREANTRFLLANDNWAGLVMDASAEHVEAIRADRAFWRYQLAAEPAFVTRDNIDSLLARHVPDPDIGILSIDIDGNDYWIWETITAVRPRIVVCEYNSVFGPSAAITIPYDPHFNRTKAHHSNLYWGASLAALCRLAQRKGYVCAGSNSAGNNAFFVRGDCAARITSVEAGQAFVSSRFRESRNAQGKLDFLSARSRWDAISHLTVIDVETGQTRVLRETVTDIR